MQTLEQFEANYRERHTLRCPHCGKMVDTSDSDFTQGNVTYWADDGPTEEYCYKCNRPFYVQEHVERTWTSGKTPDEARDA